MSRNRIEVIPAYVGDMAQLQFLKIEQNPLTFPPSDIVDHSGEDMEGWLSRLKAFLSSHGKWYALKQIEIGHRGWLF